MSLHSKLRVLIAMPSASLPVDARAHEEWMDEKVPSTPLGWPSCEGPPSTPGAFMLKEARELTNMFTEEDKANRVLNNFIFKFGEK